MIEVKCEPVSGSAMSPFVVGVATVNGVPGEAKVIYPFLAGLAQNPVRRVDGHKPVMNFFLKNNDGK